MSFSTEERQSVLKMLLKRTECSSEEADAIVDHIIELAEAIVKIARRNSSGDKNHRYDDETDRKVP